MWCTSDARHRLLLAQCHRHALSALQCDTSDNEDIMCLNFHLLDIRHPCLK